MEREKLLNGQMEGMEFGIEKKIAVGKTSFLVQLWNAK
jgi:hypothetical protein